jgi:hypothetical protein
MTYFEQSFFQSHQRPGRPARTAKLSVNQVLELRRASEDEVPGLVARLHISTGTARRIRQRQSWQWIRDPMMTLLRSMTRSTREQQRDRRAPAQWAPAWPGDKAEGSPGARRRPAQRRGAADAADRPRPPTGAKNAKTGRSSRCAPGPGSSP